MEWHVKLNRDFESTKILKCLKYPDFSQNRPRRSQLDQVRVRDAVGSAGSESGLDLNVIFVFLQIPISISLISRILQAR